MLRATGVAATARPNGRLIRRFTVTPGAAADTGRRCSATQARLFAQLSSTLYALPAL